MGQAVALSSRAIRGMFFKRLEETTRASWAPSIANMFRSDQPEETYKFLGNTPALRAWRGARRKKEPKAYGVTIVNDKYEASVEFSTDDLRRDKTEQIQARIGELAARAAVLPQKVITTLLEANGNAYDGAQFFSDRSASAVSRINNALTDTTITDPLNPTSAEMVRTILKMIQTLQSAKDDEGEPMNEFARQFVVMVPTAYWSATLAALRDDFSSAGVSNTVRAFQAQGIQITPVMNGRLVAPSSSGVLYVFRADADVKPLIWQDEIEVDLQSLAEGSDHEFWNDAHVFGTKRIGGGGYGMPEMACRMTLS